MSQTLMNKTILITGATSGIGEACAKLFAQQGARLILCGRRTERLTALQTQLTTQYQVPVHSCTLDVSVRAAVEAAITNLPPAFKDIDILINSAGGALGTDKMSEALLEDWDAMLAANVSGTLYLIRALLPSMYARNTGHIVNIGSTASHFVYPGGGVYCAAKHAVRALSKALNLESLGTAVRVTEIDPGMVETEFSLVRFKGDAERAKKLYANFTPLTAEDVADTILYAITRPAHINIAEIVLYSREQPDRIPV